MICIGRLFLAVFFFAVCVLSSCVSMVSAADLTRVSEDLWPGGVPGATHSGEGDVPQLIITKVESNVPSAAVVILPGGGYHGHAMGHEGHEFAAWFHSMGITSAICTYRLRGKGNDGKGYGHPAPMHDAQRAIQTLRARAKELNIDPDRIGVIGFSAGGHLASTVSTHFANVNATSADKIEHVSSRPSFSILCYGVLSLGKPYTHSGSQRNLLGENPDPKLLASLDNPTQVTSETPPTFLFHTAEDAAVPVENSLQYYRACVEHKVPVEMHLFFKGNHGLGLAKSTPGANQWPGLCENWLKLLGMIPTR